MRQIAIEAGSVRTPAGLRSNSSYKGGMPSHVALLRAVNLGPHNKIAMKELKALAEALGLVEVQTLLQSGNLVFRSDGGSSAVLENRLEAALREQLGLATSVVVRSAAKWQSAIEQNPFTAEARTDPSHLVLMPLKKAPPKAALSALRGAIVGRERATIVGQDLYLVYPDGIGRSKLTTLLIEKKLGVTGTGRNWNTVQKIAALL